MRETRVHPRERLDRMGGSLIVVPYGPGHRSRAGSHRSPALARCLAAGTSKEADMSGGTENSRIKEELRQTLHDLACRHGVSSFEQHVCRYLRQRFSTLVEDDGVPASDTPDLSTTRDIPVLMGNGAVVPLATSTGDHNMRGKHRTSCYEASAPGCRRRRPDPRSTCHHHHQPRRNPRDWCRGAATVFIFTTRNDRLARRGCGGGAGCTFHPPYGESYQAMFRIGSTAS